ncbi:MAG TPA: sugar ABC transporter substrate-binding protein [Thermoanaerobaculia bacterium]|jgi:multiple sugar transport system substrate-binding protein
MRRARGTRRVAAAALLLLLSCARDHRTDRLEFWGLGREGEVVAEMIPEFERRNPGIKVVIQQIPWSAAHEKLVTAVVGDSSPDVAQMGNTWVPEFAAMRALDDLGPFVAQSKVIDQRDYFPGIWATNVVGGVLHGVPWYVDTRVLFYRRDILAQVGYPNGPRTWGEWTDAMQKIVSRKLAHYPLLMPTNEWDPPVILGLSNGSGILTPDGTRGAFRQKPWSEAFLFYISLYKNGYAPATSNAQIANLYQSFAQGEFTMYITGPWNVGEFRRRLPAELQDKWSTAPMPAAPGRPRGISMAGGASLVVFRSSKNKPAARKLIEFLSEPAQQVKFFELTGDLPARRSAWQSPTLNAEPSFPAFRTQLESVAPLPQVPEWEQIATAIYDRGEAAARGTVPVDAALRRLDARADELLEKRRWIVSRDGR